MSENVVLNFRVPPSPSRLVCSACGVDAACNCGAPIISARERAARAIAANPEKSDRALAAEVDVAPNTVSAARKTTAQSCAVDTKNETHETTAQSCAVDTKNETHETSRIGRNGKIYLARRVASTKEAEVRATIRPAVERGETIPTRENLAKELGISQATVRRAIHAEHIRIETLQEEPPIDPSILSASAQEKFAALEIRLRAKLEKEFEERVQAEVSRRINEDIEPSWEARFERANLMAGRKPLTNKEYRTIMAALHPDCLNADQRTIALDIFKNKEESLRELDDSKWLPRMPGPALIRRTR